MRRAFFAAVFAVSLALASGLDLSVGVRDAPGLRFLSGLGVALEAAPWTFRGGLRFGAPSGILAEGSAAFSLPVPLVNPYLGAGAAVGLTVHSGDDSYTFAPGQASYAFFFAGLALPSRGYRPYLEAAYYAGSASFVSYSVGFVLEAFGW